MLSPVLLSFLLLISHSCLSTAFLNETTIYKSLHFFLSIQTPQLGVPFTSTCALSTQSTRNLISLSAVSFYSSQAGLLATYEAATKDGPWILSRRTHAQTVLAQGTQQTYPTFELTLTELNNTQQVYWCTVSGTYRQKSGLGSWKVSTFEGIPSAHAFTYPQVNFTSVKVDEGPSRRATCSISNFPNHRDVEYLVRFHLEPEHSLSGNYLLPEAIAVYRIKPNQMVELLTEANSRLNVTVDSVAQPKDAQLQYSITVNGNATKDATWWCVLALGKEGTQGYQEFRWSSENPSTWGIHKANAQVGSSRLEFKSFLRRQTVRLGAFSLRKMKHFWRSLNEANWTIPSANMSDGPRVRFTSSKLNETAILGICSISNFTPAGRNYSVVFSTGLGAHENKEIATYTVPSGKILEFDTETTSGWKDIVGHKKVIFPDFPVIVTGIAVMLNWMSCKLSIGEEGNAHYQEFTSVRVFLD